MQVETDLKIMKVIREFAELFGAKIRVKEDNVVQKENRYFLLNSRLKKLMASDFFYAGVYLGEIRGKKFLPSFILLRMIKEKALNKVFVDRKSAWLFVCGRDVFRQGITRILGSRKKNDYTLILNQSGECLGFGRILHDFDTIEKGTAVKNILDIGDFLRRERETQHSRKLTRY